MTSTNFPATACGELVVSLVFPTCWDGVNLASESMMDHVAYDTTATGRFDGDCPASHPVKLPEIHLYFRIQNYPGGQHVFSDGSDIHHADFFSGWNGTELQRVLDECNNYSDAASPDAFCEDFLTFRGYKKETGKQRQDADMKSTLRAIQPPALRLRETVSPEAVTGITALPRGACTGTLLAPVEHTIYSWRRRAQTTTTVGAWDTKATIAAAVCGGLAVIGFFSYFIWWWKARPPRVAEALRVNAQGSNKFRRGSISAHGGRPHAGSCCAAPHVV